MQRSLRIDQMFPQQLYIVPNIAEYLCTSLLNYFTPTFAYMRHDKDCSPRLEAAYPSRYTTLCLNCNAYAADSLIQNDANVLLIISYKFVKRFYEITFLLLIISSWKFHDVCQRFYVTRNEILARSDKK